MPYDPEWKLQFEKIREVYLNHLIGLEVGIQHVGSTAIPGLFAKPILDIDIIIEESEILNEVTKRLEGLGYLSKGDLGIPGRFAFRQSSEFTPLTHASKKWQPHHLYVCFANSLALRNHLLFRDTLRNRADLAMKYSALKKSLTNRLLFTRAEYTTRKTDFIISVLAIAGLDDDELKEITDANI
ncbi:MAG: GrpB family protein [Chitinophagaceae bacterium]|nr:GrpB family protein [Chitinophagaceae bacterium]